MRINLARALIRKNRLVAEIAKLTKDVAAENSVRVIDGMPQRVRDIANEWRILGAKSLELVNLKVAIEYGSQAIRRQILALSEFKSKAKMLQELRCQSGKSYTGRYTGKDESVEVVWEMAAFINEATRTKMLADIQKDIDETQAAIDHHNHITMIEFKSMDDEVSQKP
jgi:hypothetical protein